jgi:flavin reductase (DIM6/NTAB) family NADH-FMN oxidoreductase RutF
MSPYLVGSVVESPVGLIVSESRGRVNAMTVSFFSEVSHHPTSLWVSINKQSLTHELVLESGRFSLIVLHEKQKEIALFCGTVSGRDRDKCARLALHRGSQGFLYLDKALASVACRVSETHDLGDHTLFLAAILGGEFDSRQSIRRHLLTTDLASPK